MEQREVATESRTDFETNAADADSDDDGLEDGEELLEYETDPLDDDSDDDDD